MTSPVARSLRHSGVLAVPQLPQVVPGRPEQLPPERPAEPVDARPRPRLLLRAVGRDTRRAATGELVGVNSLRWHTLGQSEAAGTRACRTSTCMIQFFAAGLLQGARIRDHTR